MTLIAAEQIAFWSDKLRDMAATGLKYAQNIYDHERYQSIQQIAIEMLALATERPIADLEPLRETIFSRASPLVAGTAAVIDDQGKILLMRRSDNRLWNMPGGILEVGETPAAGVVREALEETGLRCAPIALVGVYDNRMWETGVIQHLYKFTFLCKLLDDGQRSEPASHAVETLEIGWFAGHVQRVRDAYRVWRGEQHAYFDK
jgi:8-oxo-dGTP pyrophosphatase MutT (NUDIX family)